MTEKKVIALSGGFDPIHVGHLQMIGDASNYTDQVMIILNSDAWLFHKKGYVFMPRVERHALLMALKGVTQVVSVDDSDGTVSKALRNHKPDYFGNGGPRGVSNTPEQDVCAELGIECVYNVGGQRTLNSEDIVEKIIAKTMKETYLDCLKHTSWGGPTADWIRRQLDTINGE